MSPSSTGDSPRSTATGNVRGAPAFPLPTRESAVANFSVELPSPQLSAITSLSHHNALKSPTSLKSQRTASFSREGIMGAAHKAQRNSSNNNNITTMSQAGDQRTADAMSTNGGGTTKLETASDGGSNNPLKRRNTDAVDYPRRRATIAVRNATGPRRATEMCISGESGRPDTNKVPNSARSVARGSHGAMGPSPSVSSARSLGRSASIGNPASSWMRVTSSSWSGSIASRACCR